MKITFCGAAGEVTGSQHLIECGKLRVLLDCGLFQGHRAESRRKNETFFHKPEQVDAVILSHAHIDHCGNLPNLHRQGFDGPVYCTAPTADVAEIMLEDSARIQVEDARYLQRKGRGGRSAEALYHEEHVRSLVKLMQPLSYREWHAIADNLRIRFRDAGHILGSAIVEMEFQELGETRRVVFTGDLGRRGMPLLHDPELVPGGDVLITESTYGDKVHPPLSDLKADLKRIINEAVKLDGRVIIPAFSLGRTQQLVYFLNELTNAGELPSVPVFVDSPLSRRVTNVHRRHLNVQDAAVQETMRTDADPYGFHGLTYIVTPQDSMELNHRKGPFVVIAASGMCESGRVLHHLKHGVGSPDNTVVIIGFQAEHTLGRRLVERRPQLKIFDQLYPLRARVEVLNGLSAHADVHDFKWWFDNLAAQTGVGQAFLVHGEQAPRQALATVLRDCTDEEPILPNLHQSFEV
jgi:metallo-beta-lactamase family protein